MAVRPVPPYLCSMREAGPRKSELAEMLIQRRDEFISRWMEAFQARLGPGAPTPTNVLDALPTFLDDIAEQLTAPLEALEASSRRLSGAHGRRRFFTGTDLQTVVLEYETILDVVVDMVFDYGPKVHLAAWQRLYRWLFAGIKSARPTPPRPPSTRSVSSSPAVARQRRWAEGFAAHATSLSARPSRSASFSTTTTRETASR